jgi:hypothetical protein
MTGDEFRLFLSTLAELPPVVVQSIRGRLRQDRALLRRHPACFFAWGRWRCFLVFACTWPGIVV